jgi:ATP synthase protein I
MSEEKKKSFDEEDRASLMRSLAPFFTIGIQMALTVVVMFFVGRWLDGVLNTAPWLMIAGLLVGSAAGLYKFIQTVSEVTRKEERQHDAKREREV